MRGRTVRTPEKASEFLSHLRETGGNVSKSCQAVDIGRVSVYAWRREDEEFARQWDEALEFGVEQLEEEARRRAFSGVDEPVFYKGEECGAVRKYSDTLLIFLLKAHRPDKYRENIKISVPEIDAEIERRLALLAAGSQASVVGTPNENERVN